VFSDADANALACWLLDDGQLDTRDPGLGYGSESWDMNTTSTRFIGVVMSAAIGGRQYLMKSGSTRRDLNAFRQGKPFGM